LFIVTPPSPCSGGQWCAMRIRTISAALSQQERGIRFEGGGEWGYRLRGERLHRNGGAKHGKADRGLPSTFGTARNRYPEPRSSHPHANENTSENHSPSSFSHSIRMTGARLRCPNAYNLHNRLPSLRRRPCVRSGRSAPVATARYPRWRPVAVIRGSRPQNTIYNN
jgi:hypothetical protein